MSKAQRVPQRSKLRQPNIKRALNVSQPDVVKCSQSGELGYSRSIASARCHNNPALMLVECLSCDSYHVRER